MSSTHPESTEILGRRPPPGAPGVTDAVLRLARRARPDLVDFWRILVARKAVVLGAGFGTALLGAVVAMTATPYYRSNAMLLIEQTKPRIVSIEDVYAGPMGQREHLTTQTEFLRSRNVAERVIRKLNLLEHPEFDPRQAPQSALGAAVSAVRGLLPAGDRAVDTDPTDALTGTVLKTFESRLRIDPIRMSQLVQVGFEATDPRLAAQIANAVAEAFIDADMDARYAMTQQASSWLNERLVTLKANLATAEQALQAYRERKGLMDRQSATQAGSGRQLEEVTQRLVEARVRRSLAQQALAQVDASRGEARESVPAISANPLFLRAREGRVDAQRRLADAAQRFGPAHPQYLAAQSDLAAAEAALRQATETAVAGVRKEHDMAVALERSMEQSVATLRATIQGTNRDEFELSNLEREVAVARQLYETFQARVRETAAAGDLRMAVARIVDPARPAMAPAKPMKAAMVAVGLLLGLVGGVAAALLLRRLDATVHTVDEAEAQLGATVLTALPRLRGEAAHVAHDRVLREPQGGFSEGIRTARTALQVATAGAADRVIVVTSARPGEGKSTVAMNLALAYSQTQRTLLIQCDMRRPHASGRNGDGRAPQGLSDLIQRKAKLSDCVRKVGGSRLLGIRAGAPVGNPLELLSSRRFRQILTALRSRFDVIILDTPPVSLVSDAIVVAAHATGVVFVVRAESTPVPLARQSLRRLSETGAPVLGTVVNALDFERATRYYGEYSAYAAAGYGGYRPARDAA